MKVKVNFFAVLRSLAKTSSIEIEVPQGSKVEDVIRLACANNENLFRRVFEPSGTSIRGDLIVLVNGVDVNLLGGLSIPADNIKEVTLIPAVHGGASTCRSEPALVNDLLSILTTKISEIDLRIIHVKLSRELSSREIIRHLEDAFKNLKVLWAVTRPGLLLSRFHILCSLYHTLKAFALGRNISNKFNIEFLLRLACEDQITNALRTAGLDANAKEFYLYVFSPDRKALEESLSALHSLPLENLKQFSDLELQEASRLLELLNISHEELSATNYKSSALDPKLKSVLTRMSLLNVKR